MFRCWLSGGMLQIGLIWKLEFPMAFIALTKLMLQGIIFLDCQLLITHRNITVNLLYRNAKEVPPKNEERRMGLHSVIFPTALLSEIGLSVDRRARSVGQISVRPWLLQNAPEPNDRRKL